MDVEMDVIPGKRSSLPIQVLKDDRIEGIETIGVRVTAISADTEVLGSEFFIQVRDASEVSIVPDVVESTVPESAPSARFVIRRFGAVPTAQISVYDIRWEGRNPALSRWPQRGEDFVATAGEVEFGQGITERTVDVPLLNDNQADGPRELMLRLVGSPDFPDSAGIGWGEVAMTLADDERSVLWQEVALDPFRPGWWQEWQRGFSLPGGEWLLMTGSRVLKLTSTGLPDPDFGRGAGQVLLPEEWVGEAGIESARALRMDGLCSSAVRRMEPCDLVGSPIEGSPIPHLERVPAWWRPLRRGDRGAGVSGRWRSFAAVDGLPVGR